MYDPSRNESQIQQKMHFHKTVQDLPIYNIHKNFETYDASELSVEEIIDTVFYNCDDKKHAQMSAQTYICHRIIDKARELKLTALFYKDHYERTKTLYEEPVYILVKNEIWGTAKKALSHPIRLILNRCSKTRSSTKKNRKVKEKTPKQKRWKTFKSPVVDDSLRSIVGKFPNLIIPKLSAKEISYYMKAKQKSFELETSKKQNLRMRKVKSNSPKKNKENIRKNAEVRRSSRLCAKKEAKSTVKANFHDKWNFLHETHVLEDRVETNFPKDKKLSVISETLSPVDYNKTNFLDDKNSSISETHLLSKYQPDLVSAEPYFQNDNAFGKTNTCELVFDAQNVDDDSNTIEFVYDEQDVEENSYSSKFVNDEQNVEENISSNELFVSEKQDIEENTSSRELFVNEEQDLEENTSSHELFVNEETSSSCEILYEVKYVEDNSYTSRYVEQGLERYSSSHELFVAEEQDLQENGPCEFVNDEQDLEENSRPCEFVNEEQDLEENSRPCEFINDELDLEENSRPCEFVDNEQNVEDNRNKSVYMENTLMDTDANIVAEQIESRIRLELEKGYDPSRYQSKYVAGDDTLEYVFKTQMDVTGETCKHLKGFGLDEGVIKSLQELYKSVHAGKNNYVFCEVFY